MTLSDAFAKTGALLTANLVPLSLTMVFPAPPQSPPKDSSLPACFIRPTGGPVSYSASQRQVIHNFDIVVLVARSDNLPTDYTALMPLFEPFLDLFEQNTTLGTATYYDTKITNIEIGPAGFNTGSDTGGDAQYVCLFLSMSVKEKKAVTMN